MMRLARAFSPLPRSGRGAGGEGPHPLRLCGEALPKLALQVAQALPQPVEERAELGPLQQPAALDEPGGRQELDGHAPRRHLRRGPQHLRVPHRHVGHLHQRLARLQHRPALTAQRIARRRPRQPHLAASPTVRRHRFA